MLLAGLVPRQRRTNAVVAGALETQVAAMSDTAHAEPARRAVRGTVAQPLTAGSTPVCRRLPHGASVRVFATAIAP